MTDAVSSALAPRRRGEHRDPVAAVQVTGALPEPGPIAVLPKHAVSTFPGYTQAVRDAGGTVAQLDSATRGLIWLDADAAALAAVLRDHPAIGWVQLPLAGIELFAEVLAAQSTDLPIWTSAKGAFAEPVAEHAVALTAAVLRDLPDKARSIRWASAPSGISLYGRRVLIVGAGGIALEIMRLLAPYGVEITVVRRSADPVPGASRTVASDQLMAVIGDADVVILAAAATDETHRMFGAEQFAAMKATAALVNIARGRLVDQDALLAALASGRLAGAGLDVTTPEPLPDGHPLWTAPRVIITSHQADTQDMVLPLLATRIRSNVQAFLGDGRYVGRVDPSLGY